MTRLLLRVGAIAATASFILFEAPVIRSGEEPASAASEKTAPPARSAPTSEHLSASYVAADAVFAAQRSAKDDPALVELRGGLAAVRAEAERLLERRGEQHTSRWIIKREDGTVESSGGSSGGEWPETERPSPEEREAERDLRAAVTTLGNSIHSAQSRVISPPRNAELLQQAIDRALRAAADTSEALAAEGGWRPGDLRGIAAKLTERALGDETRATPGGDPDASADDDEKFRTPRSPTLSTITRHRRLAPGDPLGRP